MSLNIEPRNEEVCEKFSTRVLDLEKNGAHWELYKAYPYFIDILEWLEGRRPFSAIRHNHNADDFTDAVLPNLMMIFEEIEDHDDPKGSPFIMNLLMLQDT